MSDNTNNTLRILIATDNHVGYLEEDQIRGKDSFQSFEEVLILAKHHKVDFILLGGDLFHHSQPSLYCLRHVIGLIRQHCFGDKPCEFNICSDQSINFQSRFQQGANVYDPNLNVSIPIFTIHGNHDDPVGNGNLSAMDLLASAGCANYFGRCHDLNDIKVYPILMQKGETKLALYGMGNVRDERLHHAWRDGSVSFIRPSNEHGGQTWLDDAFNMFVLHQNRVRHGPTSYVPEEFLDEFIDLVLWGHEHDCRIDPEPSHGKYISQPGSSVATSLAEGEALPKHVGLLEITGREYSLQKIRLTTVRPFQYTAVSLSEVAELRNATHDSKAVQRYLFSVVEDLIRRAQDEWDEQQDDLRLENDNNNDNSNPELQSQRNRPMPLPLIRIRVEYGGDFEAFNVVVFGKKFVSRVANPRDILKFHRQRSAGDGARRQARQRATEILNDPDASVPERLDTVRVEALVDEILGRTLEVLPENEMQDVVQKLIDKEDKKAVSSFIQQSVQRMKRSIDDENHNTSIEDLSDQFVKRRATELKEDRFNNYAREQASRNARRTRRSDNNEDDSHGE
ncbi:Metallo-dependent phosphatase-like protein [Zychaea mexicana]|uniref:Metallo-dependent phosphatase-like protein n=1 Tax=Zychaea mexicana TaxID=64656 RepID=UPI0022FF0279|nr:Metallo-dependent phosphatase-like protein [Zychaea mexicana]KAI9488966.1 Metallo-dependent phosphatase-like protein [Zychaea mexicana]